MTTHIRLLCFDLDDTLWPSAPLIQQAEQTLYAWLQDRAPALCDIHDTQSMREHRLQLLKHRPALQHDISRWRLESLVLLLEETGHAGADSLAEQAFAVFLQARHRVCYFEQVDTILEQLSQDFLIAAITNGNADVRRLSVGRHFHHAIRAEEINVSKPDSRIFEAVLAAAGVSAEEAIHIGDHPINDIAAARTLGMHTIHARLLPEQEAIENTVGFQHWRELPAAIAAIEQRERTGP